MVDRLFAYGTLLAPELLRLVIGRALDGEPATLSDYACYRVRRASYPAILQQPGGVTQGRLFAGIEAPEWGRLDEFESRLYERTLVELDLPNHARLQAYTYVVADGSRHRLTEEPWDLERFRHDHLERYLRRL